MNRACPPPSTGTAVAAAAASAAFAVLCAATVSSTVIQWARVRNALRAAPPARRHAQSQALPASARPAMRLLLVGDSTALGVGADRPRHALAGLIARDFPQALVRNVAESGATLGDVLSQLRTAGTGLDVVVVVAGGNDILRRRSMAQISHDADASMAAAAGAAPSVIWLGVANIGLAPLFLPPWSWWVSARVRRARGVFAAAALRHGACYLDFFREARDDVFSREPLRYFAADGIHPSSRTYRYCYEVLRGRLG